MKKLILIGIGLCYLASSIVFAVPPGLAGKGGATFPHGLQKQNKVPYGWSKGKKKGWNRSHFFNKDLNKEKINSGRVLPSKLDH